LAQVPIYVAYGMLEVAWPMLALSFAHAAVYALMQPAVDSHVAAASVEEARGRVQGVYSSVGLAGAFAGANGFTALYEVDFRLPLFSMGVVFGVCVLVGGLIVRWSEEKGLVAGPESEEGPEREAVTSVS
jgi:MFS family permease